MKKRVFILFVLSLVLFSACLSKPIQNMEKRSDVNESVEIPSPTFDHWSSFENDLKAINLIGKLEAYDGNIEWYYIRVYDNLNNYELFTYYVFLEADYLEKKDSIHDSWKKHSCMINNNAARSFTWGKYHLTPGCGRFQHEENKQITAFYRRIESRVRFDDKTKGEW